MASILRFEKGEAPVTAKTSAKLVAKAKAEGERKVKRQTGGGLVTPSKKPTKAQIRKIQEAISEERQRIQSFREQHFDREPAPIRDEKSEVYFAQSVKNLAIDVLGTPIAPDKRPLLKYNIRTNGFMSQYIDQRTQGFAGSVIQVSDNLKFAAHYALEYAQSYRGIARVTPQLVALQNENNALKHATDKKESTEVSGPPVVRDHPSDERGPILEPRPVSEDELERGQPDSHDSARSSSVDIQGESRGLPRDDLTDPGRDNPPKAE